jgi:hypothetical protein
VQTSGTANTLNGVFFTSSNVGIAVGDNGTVLRTTDGGGTWTTQPSGSLAQLQAICFADNNTGFAVGGTSSGTGGVILRTTDSGTSWTSQPYGSTTTIYGVSSASTTVGAVGANGLILRTNTGGATAVEQDLNRFRDGPNDFRLEQNYPNPFNPSTTISFSLPRTAVATLRIFNALGQEVALLANERKEAGYYQVTWDATVPSGIYFYSLRAGEFLQTKKMMVLK